MAPGLALLLLPPLAQCRGPAPFPGVSPRPSRLPLSPSSFTPPLASSVPAVRPGAPDRRPGKGAVCWLLPPLFPTCPAGGQDVAQACVQARAPSLPAGLAVLSSGTHHGLAQASAACTGWNGLPPSLEHSGCPQRTRPCSSAACPSSTLSLRVPALPISGEACDLGGDNQLSLPGWNHSQGTGTGRPECTRGAFAPATS